MRTLRIVSGICVLFTTLAYAHLVHHHTTHASAQELHSMSFWALTILANLAGIFSLIAGYLLLRRSS